MLVKYLVEHGAEINKEKNRDGETPLFNACLSGNEDVVKYLVEHGTDINKKSKYKLHYLMQVQEKMK